MREPKTLKMTKYTWLLVSLAALVGILLLLGISKLVENGSDMRPGETYGPEETVVVDGGTIVYHARMDRAAYPAGTAVGDWIAGCDDPDRNDHPEAYVLRHAEAQGDMTTYTYLVYAPGSTADTATPALYDGETYGYRLDLYWTEPADTGYTLSRVSVTLPTGEEAPRLRVLVDGDTLGTLVSVSAEPIPSGD